jgi:tetratricopeptide (TPR) repeat protein
MTLNNLAILYCDTQRMGEAEKAYQEALSIRRQLAQANPEAYHPDVAMTLNNLALLYSGTQRMGEAEKALTEALTLRIELARKNPAAHVRELVVGILNLGLEKLKLPPPGPAEACELAKQVREMGLTTFPDWAADLEKACPPE